MFHVTDTLIIEVLFQGEIGFGHKDELMYMHKLRMLAMNCAYFALSPFLNLFKKVI